MDRRIRWGTRRLIGAAFVALGFAAFTAGPAYAVTVPPGDDTSQQAAPAVDVGLYPPPPPPRTVPNLVGSSVSVACVRDVPVISYHVVLSNPAAATSHAAVLVITDGANRVELPLGDVSSGELSGTILWPGASADASGRGTGWPGWVYRGGTWVETDDNFGWTRDQISTTIEVNPVLPVPLAYPPASSACASPIVATAQSVGTAQSGGTALPATGGDGGALAVTALAGVGALALGGAALLLIRRRRV